MHLLERWSSPLAFSSPKYPIANWDVWEDLASQTVSCQKCFIYLQPRYHRQQRECVLKSNLLRATKAPAAARHSHNSHCFLSHWQLSQASLSRSTAVVTVHSLWPADCHWCSGADCRRPAAPSSAGPTIHASPALPVPTILKCVFVYFCICLFSYLCIFLWRPCQLSSAGAQNIKYNIDTKMSSI